MGNQPDIIEINGRKYNAQTGRIIPKSSLADAPQKTATHHASPKKPASVGFALDGLVKSSAKKSTHTKAASAHNVHPKQKKSKTLMRNAVHRPALTAIQGAAVQSAQIKANRVVEVDAERQARAKHVQKSKLIQKFSLGDVSLKRKHAVVPVQPAPISSPAKASGVNKTPSHSKAAPATASFGTALNQATSHLEPKPKKKRLNHKIAHKLRITPKTLNLATGALAAILVIGFIAYQNVPNLAVRVASARAGVSANLPGYRPAGFGMAGRIQYKPGQVSFAYASNTDDRNFKITQTKSSWNSEALVENYVSQAHRQYQTYDNKGKTIYIYDGSNATWVNGGMWYTIEGNSSLSSDQLLRLADSM